MGIPNKHFFKFPYKFLSVKSVLSQGLPLDPLPPWGDPNPGTSFFSVRPAPPSVGYREL